MFLIVAFSSAGLPGLNGFVGEFNICWAFRANSGFAVFATFALPGCWYLLHAVRQMLQGPLTKPENASLRDLSGRSCSVVPLVIRSL